MEHTSRLGAVLGDHGNRQAAATELARLQRSLLRLAFALRGRSRELDDLLVRLTNALRSGDQNVNLNDIVDAIIAALGRQQSTQHEAGDIARSRSIATRLMQMLLASAPLSWRDPATRALKRIEEAKEFSELLTVVEQAAGRLEEMVMVAPSTTSGPDAAEGRQLLLQILSRLKFSAPLSARVQSVRRALAEPAAGTNVAASADAVAELLNAEQASSQEEIDRLGGYLQQVAKKVAHLQQQLLIVDESRTASLRESEAMGHTVTHRVQDMQTSVERSDDMQVLKASIRGGLQSLNKGVGDFVESARQRSEQAEVLLTTLTAQLQTLEAETHRLRDKLTQERIRANTDPLTGLANRLAFDARLDEECKRCDQQGRSLSLIIADIDNFKSINDAHGHQTGDKVLQTVAEQLRSQLRGSDMLARFGGEEFIVLLPDTSLEQAHEAAEKLRRHIEKCRFHHKAEEVPVTISLGVALLHPGDPSEAVFERADRALYLAKTRGRNRCCSEHELPALVAR